MQSYCELPMLYHRHSNLVSMRPVTHHVIDGTITDNAVGVSTFSSRLLVLLPRLPQVPAARKILSPTAQHPRLNLTSSVSTTDITRNYVVGSYNAYNAASTAKARTEYVQI